MMFALTTEEVKLPYSLVTYLIKQLSLEGGAAVAVMVVGILLCAIVPYLLGSLNFAIIVSKLRYHDDIRKYGSGNAGATNMLRTYGKSAAAATIIGDMLKAAVSVFFGLLIFQTVSPTGGYIAALFTVLGHIFPVYYKFKGGKGVASAAITILILSPLTFLIILAIFLIIVIGTKYVSLASVMCALVYPFILYRIEGPGSHILLAMLIAIFVIFMHRENIKRLYAGNESKISLKKADKKPK